MNPKQPEWQTFTIDRRAADGEGLGPVLLSEGIPAEPRPWIEGTSGLIDLGGGWAMPSGVTLYQMLTIEDGSDTKMRLDVRVEMQMLRSRRFEVVDLRIRPKLAADAEVGIRPTMLRQIPLASLVARKAFEHLTYVAVLEGETIAAQWQPRPADVAEGPTRRSLSIVAGLYRAALIAGVPPVKAVMETLSVGRSKAADWIKRARYADLIDETWRPRKDADEHSPRVLDIRQPEAPVGTGLPSDRRDELRY